MAPSPKERAGGTTPPGPDDAASLVQVKSLSLRARDRVDLSVQLQAGLAYAKLKALQDQLGLAADEIAQVLGISPRTLTRRRDGGWLNAEESDRLVRLGVLFDEAVELFEGDTAAARAWFRRPNRALGERSPLDLSGTFVGAREVEHLIGRLEHGVVT